MAYSTRAQLHILADERKLAPEWGDRAVAMAEAFQTNPEAAADDLVGELDTGARRERLSV